MKFTIGDAIEYPEKDLNVPKHTGLFYRVNRSSYYSQSSGIFHKKLTLTPLKRKSCKGCPTCDYIFEMITEGDIEDMLDGEWKHGKMVELRVEGGKYWTDCGYEYDSWLEWVDAQ